MLSYGRDFKFETKIPGEEFEPRFSTNGASVLPLHHPTHQLSNQILILFTNERTPTQVAVKYSTI